MEQESERKGWTLLTIKTALGVLPQICRLILIFMGAAMIVVGVDFYKDAHVTLMELVDAGVLPLAAVTMPASIMMIFMGLFLIVYRRR